MMRSSALFPTLGRSSLSSTGYPHPRTTAPREPSRLRLLKDPESSGRKEPCMKTIGAVTKSSQLSANCDGGYGHGRVCRTPALARRRGSAVVLRVAERAPVRVGVESRNMLWFERLLQKRLPTKVKGRGRAPVPHGGSEKMAELGAWRVCSRGPGRPGGSPGPSFLCLLSTQNASGLRLARGEN